MITYFVIWYRILPLNPKPYLILSKSGFGGKARVIVRCWIFGGYSGSDGTLSFDSSKKALIKSSMSILINPKTLHPKTKTNVKQNNRKDEKRRIHHRAWTRSPGGHWMTLIGCWDILPYNLTQDIKRQLFLRLGVPGLRLRVWGGGFKVQVSCPQEASSSNCPGSGVFPEANSTWA